MYGLASAVPASNATLRTFAAAARTAAPASSVCDLRDRPAHRPAGRSDHACRSTGTRTARASCYKVTTADGSYYDVNGETIHEPSTDPIEPMTSLDVTQPTQRAPRRAHRRAHHRPSRSTPFPEYFRPNLDSANEQLLSPVGDAVFPASLSAVSHSDRNGRGRTTRC